MLWHHKRQILMDESRKLSGLPIRFKKEAVQEIPGTNKVRVVLPATNKRDSEILFGVDENYVERDKLPASIELDKKLIRQDRKKEEIFYTYLDPEKLYMIKWYGQGWETPSPIRTSAQVIQQAFGMGKSRTRQQMREYSEKSLPKNQRGEIIYESENANIYDHSSHNAKAEVLNEQAEKKIPAQENSLKQIPIIFTEKQIVNRSEYSHKKTKEELARLEKKVEEQRTQYEIGRIQELKRIIEQPALMMYKIILPDAPHRKDIVFKEDRFGIARNERIAYIEVPKKICHYDRKQQMKNEKLQEELNKLEKIPEEKRIKSQQMRADELKKELSKPLKMYIYVPEVMKKGIKIHFEGEKTGAIDKETNKPVYDKPEDFIVKDAHMLRTAFGMGHYYSKAEREKTALSKESNQQNQSKGFMGRIVNKVVNHGIKNKKEER